MKSKIIQILKKHDGVVSGEVLSDQLGTSRVTIWKHIQKLQVLGYEIQSTARGYHLVSSPDIPYPWEFPERTDHIHYFDQVDSTMDIARDLARKGSPQFTTVIAGRQKKGRGRLERRWISDDGGLYFTLVVRPEIPAMLGSRVNFLASLTLARIFRQLYGIDAMVKWPNDLLVGGKKIVGLLSEMEAEADMVSFINIGIGINVNNDPRSEEPNAASIMQLTGKSRSRKNLLRCFLDAIEQRLSGPFPENIIEEWKPYTATIGQRVKVQTIHSTVEGIAEDVDENGALILRCNNGEKRAVVYGDCFHQPA